jgi:hypothetical protein
MTPFFPNERIRLIQGIPVLGVTNVAIELAQMLTAKYGIPATEPRDALHISLAATHALEYLVTWNFRRIANATTRKRIEAVCIDSGFSAPIICTPEELLGE